MSKAQRKNIHAMILVILIATACIGAMVHDYMYPSVHSDIDYGYDPSRGGGHTYGR